MFKHVTMDMLSPRQNGYFIEEYREAQEGDLEKMIGGKLGIRTEVRHTQYRKETWKTFPDEIASVPISLDGSETGFSGKAVLYF